MTVAESCCVVPIEVKLKLVGDTVTEVATGVGGVGGLGGVVGELPPSPHAATSTTAANVWNFNFRVFLSFRDHMAANMRGFDRPPLPIGGEGPMKLETQSFPKLRCRHSANVD